MSIAKVINKGDDSKHSFDALLDPFHRRLLYFPVFKGVSVP